MKITEITFRAVPDTNKIQGRIIFTAEDGRAVKVYATPVPKEGQHIDPKTKTFATGWSPDHPVFVLTASVIDPVTGDALDHPADPTEKAVWWGKPISVNIGQADGALPIMNDGVTAPQHGEIKVEAGRLYLRDGENWDDMGPEVKAAQNPAMSKVQIAIVKRARGMVDEALQAYDEAGVWSDLTALPTV